MGINNGLDLFAISLFSGAGGLDLAAKRSGIRTVCYVENDPYAQGVLMSRIRDGNLDDAPIWDDIKTFDGKPWRGKVDCIFGGFPCQDLSVAGKMRGMRGERSGLWSQFARILLEVGPRFVLVENVAGILMGGAIGIVLADLAQAGYDAEWDLRGACEFMAPHTRKRVFIVAYPIRKRWNSLEENKKIGYSKEHFKSSFWKNPPEDEALDILLSMDREISAPLTGVCRVDDGLAEELDRFRLCGNGVVPQVAKIFFDRIIEMNEVKDK